MKSDRQHAYEVAVEMEICRRKRERRYYILVKRLERLLRGLSSEDFNWTLAQLRERFPDLPWEKVEDLPT